MDISQKCIAAINEFLNSKGIAPNTIYLSYDDYIELYKHCFYSWTRKIDEPLILTKFCGCKIRLKLTDNIECAAL